MKLDGKLLVQAKNVLKDKRRQNSELYLRRTEQVYDKAPGVRALDNELRATMMKLVGVTLGKNTDDKIEDIRTQNLKLQEQRRDEIRRAGYPDDYLDEKYFCSSCSDTGYIDTKICDCLMELYKKEQTKSLSSLLKLGDETFETFDLSYYDDTPLPNTNSTYRSTMKLVYNICKDFSNNFEEETKSLFFTGSPGLGKTFLSACIARVVADKGFSVVYDTATSVFSKFEDVKFQKVDDPEEMHEIRMEIKRYLECDLLILDDLGTEVGSAPTTSALYELINTRLISKRKTIISSNMNMEELCKRYSKQISSRVDGEYTTLFFCGDDIRKKKNMV